MSSIICSSRNFLPLHAIIAALQFAVPEIMPPGEARVLCKGAASALSTAIFWRGMTVDLDTDEGERRCRSPDPESTATAGTGSEVPGATGARPVKKAAGYSHPTPVAPPTGRGRSRRKAARPRSNADCLGRPIGMAGSCLGHRGGDTRGGDVKNGDLATSSTGMHKRSRDTTVGRGDGGGTPGRKAGDRNAPRNGRQFLRRYHHHVAFRRLTPPVADTETVNMPVPLSPTCLDARGYMVALGTREGPVILFDVSLRPPPISRASGALSGSANGGGGDGSGSGGASVTRVYGSLAGGEGPVSAVLLDRAKVIAAGRGSRRSGGGFVVRIYAVDSTRLLRTLRCVAEVSRMCLFDPVLAVLSTTSGRLSFRDIYAEGGSGLGQRTAVDVNAVAFAPVESATPGVGDDGGVVLHCVNSHGSMFEASTFGSVSNMHVFGAGDRSGQRSTASGRGWHVCADSQASLLIRATPQGTISGWRLLSNGRRGRSVIFSFGLNAVSPSSSSSSPSSPVTRALTSVRIAAGGTILATAWEGAPPRMWDVRLVKRAPSGKTAAGSGTEGGSSGASGAAARAAATVMANRGRLEQAGGGDSAEVRRWELASAEVAEGFPEGGGGGREGERGDNGVGGDSSLSSISGPNRAAGREGVRRGRERAQPRWVEVRPWPLGVWAVGVAVDAGGGRLVSACSDGCMRVTRLRSNNKEQRLRAAVLRGRRATP